MTLFPIHTIDSAPTDSRPVLQGIHQAYGFVPNLAGTLAGAPSAIAAYIGLAQAFDKSSLSATEQQVVLLAASIINECHYCVPAHTVIAKMKGVPDDVVQSVRDGEPLADRKLQALRVFAEAVTTKRGQVSEAEVEALLAAGYAKPQILEILVGVTLKTLTNYVNHIGHTQLDQAFEPHIWQPKKR